MRGQGAELPCGVWGNAPTAPRATNSKKVANKGAGSTSYITDSADSYQQLDLLAGDAPLRDQRQEQLESAMDAIRGKYGRDAITFGRGGKVGWNKDE